MQHSAGIANDKQMIQWTFAVSASTWAELRSLLRTAGWRICQRWCFARRSSSPRLEIRLKSSIQSNTYSAHAKRESAVPSIPDAQEAHHRAFPHANVHPKARQHPTHPHQMHTDALSLLASISATPAGRTILWRILLPTTQSRRRSSAKRLLCPLCALGAHRFARSSFKRVCFKDSLLL